jgi:hypothetical protein
MPAVRDTSGVQAREVGRAGQVATDAAHLVSLSWKTETAREGAPAALTTLAVKRWKPPRVSSDPQMLQLPSARPREYPEEPAGRLSQLLLRGCSRYRRGAEAGGGVQLTSAHFQKVAPAPPSQGKIRGGTGLHTPTAPLRVATGPAGGLHRGGLGFLAAGAVS